MRKGNEICAEFQEPCLKLDNERAQAKKTGKKTAKADDNNHGYYQSKGLSLT